LNEVRRCLALCLLFAASASVRAQDQEQKLVDRLLKPDTSFQNSAQNKKFSADRTSVNKRASVTTFYIQPAPKPKAFTGPHALSMREFNSKPPYRAGSAIPAKRLPMNAGRTYSTAASTDLRPVHDANKTVETRSNPTNRPFLVQGKSQKALDQQKPSLTIEQVRELLNKNK
jgi:hypothetical protein